MSNPRTGKCVLVVDNDEGLVGVLRCRIEAAGYRCAIATTGAMARAVFDRLRPDLVITDLAMPMGDGVDLVAHVRVRSRVPVIVMTGYCMEFKKRLGDHRDVLVFEKPFDGNALMDQVDSALAFSEARRLKASGGTDVDPIPGAAA